MAAKNTMPARLSAIAPPGGALTAMEDIKERDLILLVAEPTETKYGNGYRLTLTETTSDPETYEVLTSAVVVCKQLDKALEANAFCLPMVVRFEKQGQAWIIS